MAGRQLLDIDDFDDFHSSVETAAKVTMAAIIGIIVGIVVLIIVVTIIVCYCVCKRRPSSRGRTLYQPAPTAVTHTTTAYSTAYPAQPGVYPQQQSPMPQQPANYPMPAAPIYTPPPGQAPPPYPGLPTQGYPTATGGQNWQPPPQKLDTSPYPPVEQSHLQKASAPPPEY